MSVYRKLFSAVEDAVFQLQVKDVRECVEYVEWSTGIRNLDRNEITKIMHRVATQYKAQV